MRNDTSESIFISLAVLCAFFLGAVFVGKLVAGDYTKNIEARDKAVLNQFCAPKCIAGEIVVAKFEGGNYLCTCTRSVP